MSESKSGSPVALHNHTGHMTALELFQLPKLPTMQAGQCLLPSSGQCSCCLSWEWAHSHLDHAFDHARHRGDSSGCQMPRAADPAGHFS